MGIDDRGMRWTRPTLKAGTVLREKYHVDSVLGRRWHGDRLCRHSPQSKAIRTQGAAPRACTSATMFGLASLEKAMWPIRSSIRASCRSWTMTWPRMIRRSWSWSCSLAALSRRCSRARRASGAGVAADSRAVVGRAGCGARQGCDPSRRQAGQPVRRRMTAV
jgi:hypothetical protein